MKVTVLGGGAIGSTIAALLVRGGESVRLVDGWDENVATIRRDGVSLTTPEESFTRPVEVCSIAEFSKSKDEIDLLILSVKSYDTLTAMRLAKAGLNGGSVVISSQNGINEDEIISVIGPGRVLGCVPSFAAEMLGPGRVRKTSSQDWPAFTLGELEGGLSQRVDRIAGVLGPVGKVKLSDNIIGELWSKLILNSLSNASAGITTYNTGQLWTHPVGIALGILLGGEGVQVAEALGYDVVPIMGRIPPIRLREASQGDEGASTEVASLMTTLAGDPARGKANVPSLLQDVLKGRRTEVEYFNGYIARRGQEVGVPTPANALIVELVKQIESGTLQAGPENIEKLEKLLDTVRLA